MYPRVFKKKIKKSWLVSLIALIVIVACTSASASDAQEKAGFHFLQYYSQENDINGTGCYILSESEFDGVTNGDVIVLGGTAVFKGNIVGNIYIGYADVTFLDTASIYGDVIFLSSNITFKSGVTHVGETKQAVGIFKFLLRHYQLSDSIVYNDSQPYYIIFLSFGLFQMLIGFIIISFKKNLSSQGAVVLINQPKSVLIKGLALYFIMAALIIIFVWSVIGFPIALLLCFIYIIVIYMGQVPLAIAIGLTSNLGGVSFNNIIKPVKKKKPSLLSRFGSFYKLIRDNKVYLYFVAGTVFIEMIKLLPFVNMIINFVILPVVCFGIIAATFLNTYVLKIYFSMPFLQRNNKCDLRDNKIRDIILKDIE